MFEIRLDGTRLEIDDSATLGDILPGHPSSCSVAVIPPAEAQAALTRNIRLQTSAGEVVIEIPEEGAAIFSEEYFAGYLNSESEPAELSVKWTDRQSVAFGPFSSEIIPDRHQHRYARGDVILGCGGYDPRTSYLIFSRIPHIADHGAQADGGVVAHVVSGMAVLEEWTKGDQILRMERMMSRADTSTAFTTTDMATPLTEGMQIFSHVLASANGYRKEGIDTTRAASVEHLLRTMGSERMTVSLASSTHIRDDRMKDSAVEFEGDPHSRFEGTITTRVQGRNRGSVYIYTEDIPGSVNHTVVGQVEQGIELPILAGGGETFIVKVEPKQLDLRGMELADALKLAKERGIIAEPDTEEMQSVVFEQKPATTLEILAEGKVALTTVPLSQVITIELFEDEAPKTCHIFRSVTGLRWYDIGKMPLLMKFEDVYLFQPEVSKKTIIHRENLPEGEVPANILAMTNDSRKTAGLVGVRTVPSAEFGPTSEPMESTNIIGKILDPEKLKGLREGKPVYLREAER
ncbi:hypothetical protein AZH53_01405 [Methanomicrobiaceae archaeon CYW5]|uniref:methyl-coenzyme M reductase-associated protein Mmp3 n=1 Tax=Methanovulcanius yangii TaxID=1789227 RepID=UPI0029C9E297|nr:methanogenesis marker 3 protein [Methanovulcanius yangii]MBT8507086.1 hypothetical protein [Methanovulcanius yangii]